MEFISVHQWNQGLWEEVSPIYYEAFAGKSPKPEKVIRNMVRKQICWLHAMVEGDEVLAMAVTGELTDLQAIVIDYLAVRKDLRRKGIGFRMLDYLKEWAGELGKVNYFVIEAESDDSAESAALMKFWTSCGFLATDYIHHYIWVPERYRALYININPNEPFQGSGEELFKYIGEFHKASFSGA